MHNASYDQVFAPISVQQPGRSELFQFLIRSDDKDDEVWSGFTKFHVLKDGITVHRIRADEVLTKRYPRLEILMSGCQNGFPPQMNMAEMEASKFV